MFIVGEQDPCRTSEKAFQEAVDFMRKMGYKKVNAHVYSGVRHEILNDISKEEVIQDVIHFADKVERCLQK